jgi:signal peptidase II
MLYAVLAAALLAADQLVKAWTVSHLEPGQAAPLLPGFVELLRIHNYGAAWSSFSGMRWVLVGVTSVIVVAVLALLVRGTVRHPLGRTAGTLIVAGGLGNIVDRVRLGYVVDMFHFQFWPSYPVFNVADLCVVSGAVLGVVYYLWFYEKRDRVRK